MPSFFNHIVRVVLWSTKKKMCRVYTSGIVATMTNKHAFGNRAIMKFIGDTMGKGSRIRTHSNKTISLFAARTCPEPTSISFVNFDPKSFRQWFIGLMTWFAASVMTVNKSSRLAFNISFFAICKSRNRCGQSTTAFAEFYRGLVRGMIVHSKFSLLELAHVPSRLQRCWDNFIGYENNYTTT